MSNEIKMEVEWLNGAEVVKFDTRAFMWNAFGKEDIDRENILTNEQWIEFISQYNEGLECPDWLQNDFDKFVEKVK